jgi:hypothetical protein
MLHHSEVRLPRIMHVEPNLLDNVGDVRAGEHQVREGSDEARELSRISNRRPESGGDLGMCVHRRQDRLVVHHTNALNDDESKLVLSEEESIDLMLYGDLQKMVMRLRSIMTNSRLRPDMWCCRSIMLDAVNAVS